MSTTSPPLPAPQPHRAPTALVLTGGGARAAYQVGVLRALAGMLRLQGGREPPFPFRILVGTSAGALNAAFLASACGEGLTAFDRLARFWGGLRSDNVYHLRTSPLMRTHSLVAALLLLRRARRHSALLDTMPLVDTLHRGVPLAATEAALRTGTLDALAVGAASYNSGVHWTFCHARPDAQPQPWNRPGRRASFEPVTIEHLMASSAIPFLFPATPLWVDARREYFGDGSMRQASPLSPALHLGAARILVVGVGQPQRAGLAGGTPQGQPRATLPPSLGGIAGHALASVFHDSLQADIEQLERVNATVRRLPAAVAQGIGQREVAVLALQPSQSLDALALAHAHELPSSTRNALAAIGGLRGGGAALASYLLFEPGFVHALMALGERDAYARREALLAFLGHPG